MKDDQSWRFLWSWLKWWSYSERGSKTDIVMVLRPKKACEDSVRNLALSQCCMLRPTDYEMAYTDERDVALKLKGVI